MGAVTTKRNPQQTAGVQADGQNDEGWVRKGLGGQAGGGDASNSSRRGSLRRSTKLFN